jgi:acyl dehydratase
MIYEEIAIGATHDFGAHTFTSDEIKRFATLYDPQYFHIDEAAAASSMLGGLCASGWHTAAVMMGLVSRYFSREIERAAAAGRDLPPLGPSPGFDDLKWPKPVYPGDTVSFVGRVTAKRVSQSRPGWGIVSIETSGTNQNGEAVFSYTGHIFAKRSGG